jgi:hypothetical protein
MLRTSSRILRTSTRTNGAFHSVDGRFKSQIPEQRRIEQHNVLLAGPSLVSRISGPSPRASCTPLTSTGFLDDSSAIVPWPPSLPDHFLVNAAPAYGVASSPLPPGNRRPGPDPGPLPITAASGASFPDVRPYGDPPLPFRWERERTTTSMHPVPAAAYIRHLEGLESTLGDKQSPLERRHQLLPLSLRLLPTAPQGQPPPPCPVLLCTGAEPVHVSLQPGVLG